MTQSYSIFVFFSSVFEKMLLLIPSERWCGLIVKLYGVVLFKILVDNIFLHFQADLSREILAGRMISSRHCSPS